MLSSLFVSLLAATAVAVTPISDSDMNGLLNEGGTSLALRGQPIFFFGQSQNKVPCIPTFATHGSSQTPAAPLCAYPDVGCSCRNPGVPSGNPSPSFPVYYSYQKCDDKQIRIAYNLFYEKDGSQPEDTLGHPFDWERVIVVWRRADDGNWRQAEAFLSNHSGYKRYEWSQIQNTCNSDTCTQPRGGANGIQNGDHPKGINLSSRSLR